VDKTCGIAAGATVQDFNGTSNGGSGTTAAERLGVEDDLRQHALAALWKWRDYAANPLLDPDTAEACRVTARSCEWIVADLSVPSPVG